MSTPPPGTPPGTPPAGIPPGTPPAGIPPGTPPAGIPPGTPPAGVPPGSPPSGKRWHTREDSGIRLDREGRWWHDDELVEHPKIIEAFNIGLQPDENGKFVLRFGNDWCFVEVEDAAYQVTGVDATPQDFTLRLTDRTAEMLVLDSLCVDKDGVLMCRVKGDRAWARFSRDAQFQLGEQLHEAAGTLSLRQGDRSVVIKPR